LEIKTDINKKLKPLIESKRFKFIYGGRGGGKTYGIADILILMMIGFVPFGLSASQLKKFNRDTYKTPKLNVLCTREIQNSIKDSVHNILENRIKVLFGNKYTKLFEITRDDIKCINGNKFLFKGLYRNVTSIQSIPNINICWIEEAQAISSESMRILLPTIRENKSEVWASYNPQFDNDAINKLKNITDDKNKTEININWQDNPFFTDALKIQKDTDYKADKEIAEHTWEGKILRQGNDFIIKKSEVNNAVNRNIKDNNNKIEIGCDLARFGSDSTVFFKRQGNKVIDYKEIKQSYVNIMMSEIEMFANYDKSILVKIDEGNIGGAVVDVLRQKGYKIAGINNGSSANDKERYSNCITEQWFNFRNIIDKISIPNLERLKNELSNRKYGYTSSGKITIEKKDDYKKRAGKSPDFADALLLCFYEVEVKEYNVRFI